MDPKTEKYILSTLKDLIVKYNYWYSQTSGGGGGEEGTSVLSTGIPSGYLLQADGDNTSSWVAPGGTASYLVYTALISQSGTDTPTVIVLENTIGTITFSYVDVGVFEAVSDTLFIDGKTGVLPLIGRDALAKPIFSVSRYSQSNIEIQTTVDGVPTNGMLNQTFFEIRVYP